MFSPSPYCEIYRRLIVALPLCCEHFALAKLAILGCPLLGYNGCKRLRQFAGLELVVIRARRQFA